MHKMYIEEWLDKTIYLLGQAGDSLKHIKNLYDETKYLKTYLEKVGTSL